MNDIVATVGNGVVIIIGVYMVAAYATTAVPPIVSGVAFVILGGLGLRR
jgi:hypothetical protein